MTNQEIIIFFKNLPYSKMLLVILAVLILLFIFKSINQVGKLRKDQLRVNLILFEFILSIIILFSLFFVEFPKNEPQKIIETIGFIFTPINFMILYTYFLEKISSFLSKIIYFIISLILSLLPSFVFAIILFQLFQILQ